MDLYSWYFFINTFISETNQIAEVLHHTKHRTPGFISEGGINVYFYFPPYGNYETALHMCAYMRMCVYYVSVKI